MAGSPEQHPPEEISFDGAAMDTRTLAEGALPFAMLERIGEVLVIDDEPVMVMIMTRLLEKLGIVRVDTAGDPLTALQKLRDKRFGMVVCDIQMEPLNGIDLYRTARTTENARTPFLLTTGTYSAKIALDAKLAGVQWFILKPFSVEQIRRKIREMLHM